MRGSESIAGFGIDRSSTRGIIRVAWVVREIEPKCLGAGAGETRALRC